MYKFSIKVSIPFTIIFKNETSISVGYLLKEFEYKISSKTKNIHDIQIF